MAIPRVHSLNVNGVVMFEQLISQLEMEVPPLVVDLLVGFSDKYSRLASPVRPFDSATELLLSQSKYILRLLKEAWVFDFHSLRSSKKGLATDINADALAILRQWLFRHVIAGETDIPLASGGFTDGYSLNITFNRAGQPEFEPAHLPDRQVFAVKFPATLLEGETVVSVLAPEAWKPSLPIAVLDPPEKVGIGFVQALKHFLKHLRAYITILRKCYFQFGKLLHLAIAGYRAFIMVVNCDALLKSSVVKSATEVKPVIGFVKYLQIRQKAIFEGLFHFPRTIFNIPYSGKGVKPYRASLLLLRGW
jgi:hypothetical protein